MHANPASAATWLMGLVWASDGGLLTWNPTLCIDMLQEAYEMTLAAGLC